MTQFQLCLLTVFMLLMSNCVAGYAIDSTQVHPHFDIPQIAIVKEHKGRIHDNSIQRHALGTQAKIMDDAVKVESQEENQERPKQEKQPVKTGEGQGTTADGSDPKVNPPAKANGDATDIEGVNTDGANKGPEDAEANKSGPKQKEPTQVDKTGGKHEVGSPDEEGNAKAKPPTADAPTTESTTTEPVEEGYSTEGSSDSTSTSTHSPTETVRGADSQASVKAGVLSFILSIGMVLAIFI